MYFQASKERASISALGQRWLDRMRKGAEERFPWRRQSLARKPFQQAIDFVIPRSIIHGYEYIHDCFVLTMLFLAVDLD